MSNSKRFQDAARILRGVGLVAAQVAARSPIVQAVAATERQAAAAAQRTTAEALRAQPAGTGAEQQPECSSGATLAAAAKTQESPTSRADVAELRTSDTTTGTGGATASQMGTQGIEEDIAHNAVLRTAVFSGPPSPEDAVFGLTASDQLGSGPPPALPSEASTVSHAEVRPAAARTQAASSAQTAEPPVRRQLREARVPESPLGRIWGFAGLGASLAFGTAKGRVARLLGPAPAVGQADPGALLSEDNAERLAAALCRLRGAALKLGQMLSIQDENMLPPQFQAALERVRAGADVMPSGQLEGVLVAELGPDWRSRVAEFDDVPMAAASIGQTTTHRARLPPTTNHRSRLPTATHRARLPTANHRARLPTTTHRTRLPTTTRRARLPPTTRCGFMQVHRATTHDGRDVVMKVQYPGVARSIQSDVDNLMRLIRLTNILPKGLYAESAAEVAKRELALECDYTWEAAAQRRFKALVAADPFCAQHFFVPDVVPDLSSRGVLTSEWVPGVHIDQCVGLPQETRNAIGERLLALTLQELFDWRFMQTDPNWGNFLYNEATDKLQLIDFGAAKEYERSFVDDYLRMVVACAERDADEVVHRSIQLGFLTGDESRVMLDAHTEAGFMVGLPFATPGRYDFAAHGGLTQRVTALGSVMLKHRLTPPPEEAYSLHRKLSGAFLACIKLKAQVPARELLLDAAARHKWGIEEAGEGDASEASAA